MGLFDKMTNAVSSDEPERLRNWQPIPYDGEGNVLSPQEITDTTDVRKVIVKYDDGTTVTVRRVIDGSWQCLSCGGACSHARMAREVIEEWVRLND